MKVTRTCLSFSFISGWFFSTKLEIVVSCSCLLASELFLFGNTQYAVHGAVLGSIRSIKVHCHLLAPLFLLDISRLVLICVNITTNVDVGSSCARSFEAYLTPHTHK